MQISLKLTDVLEKRGKSLYWLSQQTGINYSTLWTAVRGRDGIAYRTLAKICEALECTPGDILSLTADKPEKEKPQ